MSCEHYFYNCSKEFVDCVDPTLYQELTDIINSLPISETQSEILRYFHSFFPSGQHFEYCRFSNTERFCPLISSSSSPANILLFMVN